MSRLAVEKTRADFADSLIAERAIDLGCEKVVTFDRNAVKAIAGMELLS